MFVKGNAFCKDLDWLTVKSYGEMWIVGESCYGGQCSGSTFKWFMNSQDVMLLQFWVFGIALVVFFWLFSCAGVLLDKLHNMCGHR